MEPRPRQQHNATIMSGTQRLPQSIALSNPPSIAQLPDQPSLRGETCRRQGVLGWDGVGASRQRRRRVERLSPGRRPSKRRCNATRQGFPQGSRQTRRAAGAGTLRWSRPRAARALERRTAGVLGGGSLSSLSKWTVHRGLPCSNLCSLSPKIMARARTSAEMRGAR
jgi:hypothetical protein